eukprot:INCI18845.1.p1 GENE.INCI18845.1~~INCI18845.1.p1  ORF type:complete len:101 (+),score=16.25 INCI18845.1:409-711(+)
MFSQAFWTAHSPKTVKVGIWYPAATSFITWQRRKRANTVRLNPAAEKAKTAAKRAQTTATQQQVVTSCIATNRKELLPAQLLNCFLRLPEEFSVGIFLQH